jgi:hypothetical protein
VMPWPQLQFVTYIYNVFEYNMRFKSRPIQSENLTESRSHRNSLLNL